MMEKAVESPGKIALEAVTDKARDSVLRQQALGLANAHGGGENAGITVKRAESYLKFLKGE